VRETLVAAGAPEVDACTLFDVFEGPPLEPGRRSLAFAVELRAPDRTLTDDEAQTVVDRMVAAIAEGFDGSLRTG
jgi:phenylalanyl-tRNA synthetase beta chain